MSVRQVLIADDDPGMLGLLRCALESLGLEVRETRDAMSVLTMVHRSPPDLIVLDVGMPGGNGLGACEMLASDPSVARIPVIILTGRSDDATLHRCQALGAHYVCKGADAVDRIRWHVGRLLNLAAVPAAAVPDVYVG